MRTMRRRTFLKTLGATMLAAGSAPAFIRQLGAARKVTFTLPWLVVGGHAFEFVAQKKYWPERGLDVQIFRGYGSADACKKVAAGLFMFGEASYGPLVATAAAGGDLVGFGVKLQQNPMCLVCRTDKGIQRPVDINGKRVAAAPGSGATQLLPAFYASTGIDPKKVNVISVDPAAKVPALMADRADCIEIYYVSMASLTRQRPVVTFLFGDYGLPMLDLGLIAPTKILQSEPDLCQALFDGAMEGLKFQLLHPDETLEIMMEAHPELRSSPRDILETDLGRTNYLCLDPVVKEKGLGYMKEEDMRATRENVLKYMGIAKAPPTDALFTNRFVGKVKMSEAEYRQASSLAAKYAPKMA